MMIDWGMGVAHQRDYLTATAPFLDIAKIAVGVSGVLDRQVLRDKIACYREFAVEPFIGGQFLEYGIARHGLGIAPRYFEEAAKLGFAVVEVSDNNLDIAAEDKQELIRLGRERFGLKILGEVGSKKEISSPQAMVEGIRKCREAGAWKVFVEGAEFTSKTDGSLLPEVVKTVAEGVDPADILLELPGIWIPHVHLCGIHDMIVFFLEEFGPSINIANVLPEMVVMVETLRAGVGVKLAVEGK